MRSFGAAELKAARRHETITRRRSAAEQHRLAQAGREIKAKNIGKRFRPGSAGAIVARTFRSPESPVLTISPAPRTRDCRG